MNDRLNENWINDKFLEATLDAEEAYGKLELPVWERSRLADLAGLENDEALLHAWTAECQILRGREVLNAARLSGDVSL